MAIFPLYKFFKGDQNHAKMLTQRSIPLAGLCSRGIKYDQNYDLFQHNANDSVND